jgi:hypothetical protein
MSARAAGFSRAILAAAVSPAIGHRQFERRSHDPVAPTPRKGTPVGWSPSSVREVLYRPLYRGEVIYNQTRRRDREGTTTWAPRPDSEWLRVERPELRIVAADVWTATRARLQSLRTHGRDALMPSSINTTKSNRIKRSG